MLWILIDTQIHKRPKSRECLRSTQPQMGMTHPELRDYQGRGSRKALRVRSQGGLERNSILQIWQDSVFVSSQQLRTAQDMYKINPVNIPSWSWKRHESSSITNYWQLMTSGGGRVSVLWGCGPSMLTTVHGPKPVGRWVAQIRLRGHLKRSGWIWEGSRRSWGVGVEMINLKELIIFLKSTAGMRAPRTGWVACMPVGYSRANKHFGGEICTKQRDIKTENLGNHK